MSKFDIKCILVLSLVEAGQDTMGILELGTLAYNLPEIYTIYEPKITFSKLFRQVSNTIELL